MWGKNKEIDKIDEEIESMETELSKRKEAKMQRPMPELPPKKQEIQYVEREISLSLINEKLNYIISKLDQS